MHNDANDLAATGPASLPRDHPLLPRCRTCTAALRNGTRFCTHCGQPQLAGLKRPAAAATASVTAAEAPPKPQRPTTHRKARRKRIRILPAMKAVFAFFGAMFGLLLFFSIFSAVVPDPSAAIEIAFAVAFAVLVLAVVVPSNTVSRQSFAFKPGKHLLFVGIAFAAMAAFMFVYFAVLTPLTSGIEGVETNIARAYVENGYSLLAIIVLIAVFPAIFEELAFRGYIQTRLMRALSVHEALLIQAVLFSLLHLSLLILISHTVMGLIFGWLVYKTKSLTPAILLHFLWNASIVAIDYASL